MRMYLAIGLLMNTRPKQHAKLIQHPMIRNGRLPYLFANLSPIAQKSTPKKKIDPKRLISKLGLQYISISETQFVNDLGKNALRVKLVPKIQVML